MDLSIPAPESQGRALVTHVRPKTLLNTNAASDDGIVLSESDDDVLGESGLEDLFNNGGDQSFTNNINGGPVNKNRMNMVHVPSWGELDHGARAIILKTLSEDLGSFQAACKTLGLEPNEVEAFLERHGAEREQAAAWRRGLNKPVADAGAAGDYDGPEATGPVHVERETIARACAWLEFLGLDELADAVSRWARRTTPWPLEIRRSDFNPTGLGAAHEDLPDLVPTPPDESARPVNNVEPRLEDDSRVFIAFRAAEQQQRPGVFRIHSILLPEGAIVVGPDGVKELLFGGRYRLCYADNGLVAGAAAADEFLICANHTQQPGKGERARRDDDAQDQLQQAPEHTRTANALSPQAHNGKGENKETNTPSIPNQSSATIEAAAINDNVLAVSQSGTSGNGIQSPQEQTQFFTSAATGLLSSPDLHEIKVRNLWLPNIGSPQGTHANPTPLVRPSLFDHHLRVANQSISQPSFAWPQDLHVGALSSVVYQIFAPLPDLGLENAFSPGLEGISPEPSLARSQNPQGAPHHGTNENQTQTQARLAYDGATAAVIGTVRDGPTIKDSSVLRDLAIEPPQQQQRRRHPGAGPFHDNANVFGPPRKQKIPELVGLAHRCRGGRVLFQFRLPAGYRVLSPAGYAMNFDDGAKQGPNDGECPGGVGGLYTVVLRGGSAAAAAPGTSLLPMVPELDDRVDLRMNLPERMVVFRNKKLLPRLTEVGFHDVSVVQTSEGNKLDLVCENGRYQVFGDMVLSDSQSFMLGQPEKMDLDEPEIPSDPFTSAQAPQRPNPNQNAEPEPMDVDIPVEEDQANTEPDAEVDPVAEALRYLAPHREWLDAEDAREKHEEYRNLRRSQRAQYAQRMAELEAAAEVARHQRAANPIRTTRGRVVSRPAGFQGTFNWAEEVSSMGESSSSSDSGDSGTEIQEDARELITAAPPTQSAATVARRNDRVTSTSSVSEPKIPVLMPMSRPDSRASSSQRGNSGSSRGSLPPSRDAPKRVSAQSRPRARSGRTTETANDTKVSRSQQRGFSRESAMPNIKLVPQKRSLRGALSQQDGASLDTLSTKKGKASVVEPSPKKLRTGKSYAPRAQLGVPATVAACGEHDADDTPVSQPGTSTPTEPPKRRRGRPRKYPLEVPASSEGKLRGRPRKALVIGTDNSEAKPQLKAALAVEPISSKGERSRLVMGRHRSNPATHDRGGDVAATPDDGEGEGEGNAVPYVPGRAKDLSIIRRQHAATTNKEAGDIDSDETEVEGGDADANGYNQGKFEFGGTKTNRK
ncbi:hypothetical protein DL762_009231 [Monosporascus cannonballus]|uniref:Uncharacterized protein n=1 Tax=Monosporascus cannonballus TaxID=155416 RepID=A0ABY0GUA3_9PEZI|nr:hypothetical protein DL762_009231 [Monosporascus cannonballus]